jgi:hypothetical protein
LKQLLNTLIAPTTFCSSVVRQVKTGVGSLMLNKHYYKEIDISSNGERGDIKRIAINVSQACNALKRKNIQNV